MYITLALLYIYNQDSWNYEITLCWSHNTTLESIWWHMMKNLWPTYNTSGFAHVIKQWVPFQNSPLWWRHNGRDGVSNHQAHDCLLNYIHRSKKTSKLRVTGLCAGNSPGPVNSPHKGPVTRKMFPLDDVIMLARSRWFDFKDPAVMIYASMNCIINTPWNVFSSVRRQAITPTITDLLSIASFEEILVSLNQTMYKHHFNILHLYMPSRKCRPLRLRCVEWKVGESFPEFAISPTGSHQKLYPAIAEEPFDTYSNHQMKTFSALLALFAGNSPVTGEFPHNGQWRGTLMFIWSAPEETVK